MSAYVVPLLSGEHMGSERRAR